MAYDLIPISGPFIPTIASLNFHFLLLIKRGILIFGNHPSHSYVTSFCAGFFSTAKGHAFDSSASEMLQHLLPTFYGVMEILRWKNFMGIWVGTLLLTFPIPIYIARKFWLFHFLYFQLLRTSSKSPSTFL